MTTNYQWLGSIAKLGLLLMMGVSMSADAGLFGFGSTNWKEEALQNDGSVIIVKRSQSRGGRHIIGDIPPIKAQSITFTLPNSDKVITWKDEATEDVGHANFDILALHILNGTPYLVTSPSLCVAYNKMGRPNPPYIFFKYAGAEWQRIPLSQFPAEFKNFNLIISTPDDENELTSQSPILVAVIKKYNSRMTQLEYQTIARKPGGYSALGCIDFNTPQMRSPKAPIPIPPKNDPQK